MSNKFPMRFKNEDELLSFVRDNISRTESEKFDYYDIYVTTTLKLFGKDIAEVTSTRNYN